MSGHRRWREGVGGGLICEGVKLGVADGYGETVVLETSVMILSSVMASLLPVTFPTPSATRSSDSKFPHPLESAP